MSKHNDEIISPPYPARDVTSAELYDYLEQVRTWVVVLLPDLNAQLEGLTLSRPKQLGLKRVYVNNVTVTVYQIHLGFLRRLRETWDHLVRVYESEDDWESPACTANKGIILQQAIAMIDDVFTDPETREARAEEMQAQFRRMMESIQQAVNKAIEPQQPD